MLTHLGRSLGDAFDQVCLASLRMSASPVDNASYVDTRLHPCEPICLLLGHAVHLTELMGRALCVKAQSSLKMTPVADSTLPTQRDTAPVNDEDENLSADIVDQFHFGGFQPKQSTEDGKHQGSDQAQRRTKKEARHCFPAGDLMIVLSKDHAGLCRGSHSLTVLKIEVAKACKGPVLMRCILY